ncbi:2-aminoadipate transaminase [mine drainage metagenome]|uniref:2-aminoadipate transaminase n=1 Tax=mine drainage metagenome TaxID=410659 RepID=A0A1J5Q1D8_9ZZZZ
MNELSHGSRLDAFVDRYAERTKSMTTSEIRSLFAVASRPEVVSLAGGMPNLTALPIDEISKVFADVIQEEGQVALQYGSGQGHPALREQITDIMALEGISAHPDDVIVTTGSQQALDLIARIFIDPGDVVLAEAPSYVGALGTFRQYQAQIVHIAMDEDGLIPESVRQAISAVRARGGKIKFLYTIPNFHNPAGVTLSLIRRQEIIEIAKANDILIIEDNPYGLLGFDEEPYRAMRADDRENVIYLGSFSKTFAPGLRVGWAAAPHAVREKMVMASESTILCPSNFAQMAISRYFATQPWLDQIKNFRELYRERRDAMLEALDQHFPASATWTKPRGGFYVWATLPEGIDTKAMLPRAVTARVAYVPGTAFYADGFGTWSMRLSYCYPTPERIQEGIRRLAGVIDEEIELRQTFGTLSGEKIHD